MATPGPNYPITSQVSMSSPLMSSQSPAPSGYTQPPVSTGYTQAQTTGPGLPHQQSFPGPGPTQMTPPPQMTSPTKPVNTVALCKLGQETNQELVIKLLEVFRLFKTLQLPNGTNNTICQDRRMKIEESVKYVPTIFRKLRFIYDKVSEMVVDPEENPEEVLVPLKGEPIEEKNTNTEAYKYTSEEHKQLVEQIQHKNEQIKEVIDKIRTIIWELNTMIVMRKT